MVLGDIRDAERDQAFDHLAHLVDVPGRARLDGRRQSAEGRDVVVKLAFGRLGHPGDRLVERQVREVPPGAGVDLVVDVGDVAGVDDMPGAVEVTEQAEEHVEHDDRPGVADMGEVVDRRAADIDPHRGRIDRRERLLPPGQGVVEAQGRRRRAPRLCRLSAPGCAFRHRTSRLRATASGAVRDRPDDRFSMVFGKTETRTSQLEASR